MTAITCGCACHAVGEAPVLGTVENARNLHATCGYLCSDCADAWDRHFRASGAERRYPGETPITHKNPAHPKEGPS